MRQKPMGHKEGIAVKDTLRYCLQRTNTTKDELIELTGLPSEIVEEALTISCCNIKTADIFKMCEAMNISKRFLIEMSANFYEMLPEARELFMYTMACDDIKQRKILKFHYEYAQACAISAEAGEEYIKKALESIGANYDDFQEYRRKNPRLIY